MKKSTIKKLLKEKRKIVSTKQGNYRLIGNEVVLIRDYEVATNMEVIEELATIKNKKIEGERWNKTDIIDAGTPDFAEEIKVLDPDKKLHIINRFEYRYIGRKEIITVDKRDINKKYFDILREITSLSYFGIFDKILVGYNYDNEVIIVIAGMKT